MSREIGLPCARGGRGDVRTGPRGGILGAGSSKTRGSLSNRRRHPYRAFPGKVRLLEGTSSPGTSPPRRCHRAAGCTHNAHRNWDMEVRLILIHSGWGGRLPFLIARGRSRARRRSIRRWGRLRHRLRHRARRRKRVTESTRWHTRPSTPWSLGKNRATHRCNSRRRTRSP